jgi:hypothetical protein
VPSRDSIGIRIAFNCIPGTENTVADAFSRTDEIGIACVEGEISPNDSRLKYSGEPIEDTERMFHATIHSSYHSLLDKQQLMDCFLLHPSFDEDDR